MRRENRKVEFAIRRAWTGATRRLAAIFDVESAAAKVVVEHGSAALPIGVRCVALRHTVVDVSRGPAVASVGGVVGAFEGVAVDRVGVAVSVVLDWERAVRAWCAGRGGREGCSGCCRPTNRRVEGSAYDLMVK